MEHARDHILAPRQTPDDDLLEVEIPDREVGENVNEYQSLSSEAQFAHVLFGGKAVTAAPELEQLEDEDGQLGLPGLLSPEQTAMMLARRETEMKARSQRVTAAGNDTSVAAEEEALYEKLRAIRREINVLVNRLSMRTSKSHSDIHVQLRKAVGGPSSADASLDVLQRRRDWLLSRLH
jgi:hypothetical protein